jgi:hypothetical protein
VSRGPGQLQSHPRSPPKGARRHHESPCLQGAVRGPRQLLAEQPAQGPRKSFAHGLHYPAGGAKPKSAALLLDALLPTVGRSRISCWRGR